MTEAYDGREVGGIDPVVLRFPHAGVWVGMVAL
jgi:hypothetical protein